MIFFFLFESFTNRSSTHKNSPPKFMESKKKNDEWEKRGEMKEMKNKP